MVRFKHRYLLIDIIYPPTPSDPSTANKPRTNTTLLTSASNIHLQIHRPTPDTLTPPALARAVREAVSELYGDWGMGRVGGGGGGGVSVKYLSPATSTAIIRCPRASYRLVWGALTYMSSLPISKAPPSSAASANMQRECLFRVVRVSGTMRKAEEAAIARARREMGRVLGIKGEGVGTGVLEGMFGGEIGGDVDVDVEMGDEEEEDDEDESE
ncbi:hypothetical protein AJ79_06101 [Helicocarpus griseus UAMH5409]|uniref:Uncharacterized protein n=1 Tax=Helicocarpus griseus UAMH5409 TaxID=1447875 RepID=A0A2B7XH48_9EURO|nr:hypothetical protein AJ79_06101 [Helicocarpus griseus UAMH5409]